LQDGGRDRNHTFGQPPPFKSRLYPIEVKGWHASELVRMPLAREENRRGNNNLMHAGRVELV